MKQKIGLLRPADPAPTAPEAALRAARVARGDRDRRALAPVHGATSIGMIVCETS